MLVSGIWQDAYVETRHPDYIARCEAFYALSEDMTQADIWFETDCAAPVSITLYDPDGQPVGTGSRITVKTRACGGAAARASRRSTPLRRAPRITRSQAASA